MHTRKIYIGGKERIFTAADRHSHLTNINQREASFRSIAIQIASAAFIPSNRSNS